MKVLLSALACEPGKGSELEVGYRAMLAAAHRHEVWVLTNADTLPLVAAAIAGTEAAARIHLVGIEFGLDQKTFARLTVSGFHRYYDRWQRRAADRARELDREVDFDLVHHVTLATYWTRAGAATLQKPLVLGPVGGGVETPWRLVPELGWRGLGQDVGRVTVRRLLGRLGPSYRAQRKARVVFAQNAATAARLETRGEVIVLSNATAIDLGPVPACGPRTKDIYLVGRLTAWKAPMLAVRAMRYVQDPDCVLHVCGDGAERRRMERAARRWGVRDRIRFDGWLTRDALLARLASAGALIHPALHEEAGLCVAEALSLGTPVVCLDRGGPPALLAEWPETRSEAVWRPVPGDGPGARDGRGQVPGRAARDTPSRARTTSILRGRAAGRVRPCGGGRPRAASAPAAASCGLSPRETAGLRQLGHHDRLRASRSMRSAGRCPRSCSAWRSPRPSCRDCGPSSPSGTSGRSRSAAGRGGTPSSTGWPARTRCHPGVAPLPFPVGEAALQRARAGRLGTAPLLRVDRAARTGRACTRQYRGASFRVPACLDSFVCDGWQVRVVEPLPRYHRATRWDPGLIRQVADDIPSALAGLLPRPSDAPRHWIPVHGDFVPWNLRQSVGGQLWLVDWEDAWWGPPGADLVRYLVACESLRRSAPEAAARAAHREIDSRIDLGGRGELLAGAPQSGRRCRPRTSRAAPRGTRAGEPGRSGHSACSPEPTPPVSRIRRSGQARRMRRGCGSRSSTTSSSGPTPSVAATGSCWRRSAPSTRSPSSRCASTTLSRTASSGCGCRPCSGRWPCCS